jgi:hypothetical protein
VENKTFTLCLKEFSTPDGGGSPKLRKEWPVRPSAFIFDFPLHPDLLLCAKLAQHKQKGPQMEIKYEGLATNLPKQGTPAHTEILQRIQWYLGSAAWNQQYADEPTVQEIYLAKDLGMAEDADEPSPGWFTFAEYPTPEAEYYCVFVNEENSGAPTAAVYRSPATGEYMLDL